MTTDGGSAPGRPSGGFGALPDPLRAILLILMAMLTFSMMDGIQKYLTVSYSPVQIVWGRSLFAWLVLAPLAWKYRAQRPFRSTRPELQVGRGLCLLGSAVLFVVALSYLDLATAASVSFVAPMMTTALSIPLLGEKVGIRRWSAVVVGFCGVLIIVRPGTDGFNPATLIPIASATSWALGLIITRKMSAADTPLTTLLYTAGVGVVVCSVAVPFFWAELTLVAWALLMALGFMYMFGQYVLIRAYTLAAASVLAPFSYSGIIWSGLIAVLVFHTLPDLQTWCGTAIIIASGIYTWHRERVTSRRKAQGTT